ncbi:PAS domain S-box protein [Cytophagales bacterium LB-30]|uniref:histidine kinase n=2 Tax=Shiella aurantiaca TaxID=3058365 RepID=A0ABT8F3I1_9BACT|nr:PAS domain S-box protein [Shiella aurantiaca]
MGRLIQAEERVAALTQMLNSHEEMYRNLFNNLGDEVHQWRLIRDDRGAIVTWELVDANPSALKSWNKTKEEVIGKLTNEIFGYDATAQFMPTIRKIFEMHESVTWVEYFEPTHQYLSMKTIPMGEYFISTGRDITSDILAERRLKESEQKFKSLFKNSSVAKILVDTHGNYLDVNDSACELLGYSFEELMMMSISQIINAPLQSEDTYFQRRNEASEIEIKRKDGEIRMVEVFTKEIDSNQYLSTLIDVTEKRKNERERILAEEKLRNITNSVPGAIYQFKFHADGSYSMPYISERAVDLLGFDYEKMMDVNFLFSRIHPEDMERIMHSIFEANIENTLWSQEFKTLNSAGAIVWIKGYSYSIRDFDGGIVHNGVFLDVTEKKQAEEALRVSQQEYQNITENLPGIVLRHRLTAEGRNELLFVSKGVEDMYGVPAEEVMADNQLIWKRIPQEDFAIFMALIQESAKKLSPWKFEHRVQLTDQTEKWVLMKGIPFEQYDGSIIWDTIGIDITPQKKAEQELEQLNKNLEDLVQERAMKAIKLAKELELYWLAAENAKSGVWRLDMRTNKLEWDDIMYQLYGIDRKDFSGAFDAWGKNLHPEDKDRAINDFNEAISKRTIFDSLFRIINPNTHQISHIRAKGKVELDEEGNVIAVYGTNWDVTREMELADEREKALNTLKETQSQLIQSEKMASLGVLTAGVAHEINNPLNYIHGGYTAIKNLVEEQKEIERAELSECLEWIKIGTDRATQIVKSLNLFSRNTNSLIEECSIHALIDDSLLILQNKYKGRIDIIKKYSSAQPLVVGNSGRLSQALLNLLSNAIDAIANKGAISIETALSKKYIKISISDNGCGIAPEIIERVIDPFFTTKPPGKGTGLGLYITKAIMDEHNGRMQITSELNKGTLVVLELPNKNV